jgi:GNAT superfamily N-acetyltransferase
MQKQRDHFFLSTDKSRIQIDRVHRFLSLEAYWCLGIPTKTVTKAMENSLCFGIYDQSLTKEIQIGYARIVSDLATFAWLCDLYVEKEYRGLGLSKWLVESILEHSDLRGLRRICLATKDAHTLYTKYGFEVTATPANWLEIKDDAIYQQGKA